MQEGYMSLERPIRLKEAVRLYGVQRLHPMDRRLEEELPKRFPLNMSNRRETALVTMIKEK